MDAKKFDLLYLIGLVISLIGFFLLYVNKQVYLTGDFLYSLNEILTPLIVSIFIYGGIIIIVVELILTKDYNKLYELIIAYGGKALKYPITYFIIAFITITILSILLNGIYGISIVYMCVIASIIFVFVKTRNYTYLILSVFLVVIFIDGTIPYEIIDKVYFLFGSIGIFSYLYAIFLIGVTIYKYFKKLLKIEELYTMFDYTLLILLGLYFEMGTYIHSHGATFAEEWEVIKEPLFPLMTILILGYTTYVMYRMYSGGYLNNKKIKKVI